MPPVFLVLNSCLNECVCMHNMYILLDKIPSRAFCQGHTVDVYVYNTPLVLIIQKYW